MKTEQCSTDSMKQRMRALLWDTVDYYETTKAFGFSEPLGLCDYYDPKTGAMCAVGRIMKNPEEFTELQCSIPDWGKDERVESILANIKDEYKNLPQKFLSLLQRVHDSWAESREIDEDGNYIMDYQFPLWDYRQLINYIEDYK